MPKNVKLPDGSIVAFPDNMDDDAIGAAIKANQPAAPSQHPILDAASDFGKGLLKSGVSTISAADDFAAKHLPAWFTTPIGQAATPENSARAVAATKQLATPTNTVQSIGKGIGNAAQFFIPGAGEEAAESMLAPTIGKAAAKIGTKALGSGVVNAAQGGSFLGGAAAGAGGAALGVGMKALAPTLAESALKVTGNDRIYGRTLGRAILDDTKGFRPDTITKSAQGTIDRLTPELEVLADQAGQNGSRGSLAGARGIVGQNIQTNLNNRAVDSAADLDPIKNFLKTDAVTGQPLAENQTPTGLLRLKRGTDADFVGNWNPNKQSAAALDTAKSVYGNLADEFHASAPGTADLDQRISSLIPVVDRASRAGRAAGITENVLNKFRTPTGALTGAIGGGGVGYERGGIPGALLGAGVGAIAPALIASPEAQMLAARTLNSNIVPKLATGVTGLGLQLKR